MTDLFSARLSRTRGTDRARTAVLAAGLGLALVLSPHARAEDAASSSANLVQMPSLAPLTKKVLPAVVNVSVVEKAGADDQSADDGEDTSPNFPQGTPFDDFLRKFFEQQGINPGHPGPQPHRQQLALGSGFIIDPAGYVVTNNHVIDGSEKVTVILQDNSKHVAKIVGRDPKTDLALLKIDNGGKPLPYVAFGDSGIEQVGDWVVAVGNPFGLGGTVSAGIVSARGRDIHSGPYDNFLQIDAPINRGNSGGPTFNLKGEVIGINTAIYSPNGGSVGIGFAIPSDLAKPVISQLREHGKVSRGWLGVQIQEVTPAIAKSMGLANDHGALVADVTKGSPAEKAGFKQGDVIESFNGHAIEKLRDLPIIVAETPVGTAVKVDVRRQGKEMALDTTIVEQPANMEKLASNDEEQPSAKPERASALGLNLQPLTPELRKQLKVPGRVKGVVVSAIADSSPLADVDLQPGDVIVAVNQQPVTTTQEAATKLKAAQSSPGKNLLLQINRHGMNAFVAWSGQSDNG